MPTYNGDMHIHSTFSKYSKESIEEILKTAQEKNLEFIALTDSANFRIQPVNEVLNRLKERNRIIDEINNPNDIKIIKGIEVAEPHLYKEELNYIKDNLELDYILGSIHHIYGIPLEKMVKNKDAYIMYLRSLLNTVEKSDIDAVAHIDYIKRYITNQEYDVNLLISIYKIMIEKNIALEVNTSGFRKHLETFPDKELIELYKYLGGKRIVIGSSAHNKYEIYDHIDDTSKDLEDLEFDQGYILKRKFKSKK